jgi:hypothetical protein
MSNRKRLAAYLLLPPLLLAGGQAMALFKERMANPELYGVLFNNYDPNFYTGFAPRVQEKEHITIHLGRGNQVRVRMVLSEDAIVNFVPDQVARHAVFQEVIDKDIITLTTNMAWEDYDAKVKEQGLPELAARRSKMSADEWRQANLEMIDKLNPSRLHHIKRDFGAMANDFATSLKAAEEPKDLEVKLDLINDLFPKRIFLTDLTPGQDATFAELMALAKADDMAAFTPGTEAFFQEITGNLYAIQDGKLDFYEFTSVFPAGTYDATTKFEGRTIPRISTTGVWTLIPREHGTGDTGMVDYISKAGYYGMMPMLPYQYAGGSSYNAFHNPGISNWMGGHPLIPKEWKENAEGSRNGKPFLRSSITSRGPVSHGCTRMSPGHLSEFREMLPSTSDGMEGIRVFLNLSQCYDVFDVDGDGTEEAMGVQYYIAFQAKSRVANLLWVQNDRKGFYDWMYGDEIVYGPPGEVIVKKPYECEFVKRKAKQGKRHENIKLYEAPYEPELLQFYTINGVKPATPKGYDFNRELRRVGYGYEVDRKVLRLE